MLTPSTAAGADPNTYDLVIPNWDGNQPAELDGCGTRVELCYTVTLSPAQLLVRFRERRVYRRDGAYLPWTLTRTDRQLPPGSTDMFGAIVRNHVLLEFSKLIFDVMEVHH